MLDVIKEYWLKWVMGIAGTGILAGFKYLSAKQKEVKLRQDATEKGIQALLRDRIVQSYYHYSEKGTITLHGLESIELMYEEYHNLGGNGIVTKLVDDIRKLEVVDN